MPFFVGIGPLRFPFSADFFIFCTVAFSGSAQLQQAWIVRGPRPLRFGATSVVESPAPLSLFCRANPSTRPSVMQDIIPLCCTPLCKTQFQYAAHHEFGPWSLEAVANAGSVSRSRLSQIGRELYPRLGTLPSGCRLPQVVVETGPHDAIPWAVIVSGNELGRDPSAQTVDQPESRRAPEIVLCDHTLANRASLEQFRAIRTSQQA